MWGPTASCPACSKRLTPHCESRGCRWGLCEFCQIVWTRLGRAKPADELRKIGRAQ